MVNSKFLIINKNPNLKIITFDSIHDLISWLWGRDIKDLELFVNLELDSDLDQFEKELKNLIYISHTDEELLNFLQKLNDEKLYTGKCVLRDSTTGRGWRLHETSGEDAVENVREAIENYMKQKGNSK